MKIYRCKSCTSKHLVFSSEAKWDEIKQEFVYKLEPFYFDADQAFCEVCDNWVDFELTEE